MSKGVSKDVRGVRGSRGTPGVSKWVNRDVRGVMGSRGTPGGSREIRGVVKVSQGQGCISCGPCSCPELTEDHVLPSAYVEIFRTVTRNAVNKSV